MKISLLHPSRNRPGQALLTKNKWLDNATNPVHEYILSIDNDDPTADEYKTFFSNVIQNDNRSLVDAVNHAAKISTGDLLIVVSDDFDCFPGWDVALLKELKGKKDFCVKTEDGVNDWIITLPILDREYYNRFGYIYNPDYKHMFCDTEMTSVGHYLNKIIYSKLYFPHNHYTTLRTAKDALNARNDATWQQGEELYLLRLAEDFGLSPDEIKQRFEYSNPLHRRHISFLVTRGIRNF